LRQRQYIDGSNGGLIRECRMVIPGLLTFTMQTRPADLRRITSRHVSAHRLERAKELLTRGDQWPLDITIALNFFSGEFHARFHKRIGVTPSQYRRNFERH
jgi:AraC-like DNA-binding protein